MFDLDDPRYRPLWLRLLLSGLPLAWGIVEIFIGSVAWAVLFIGIGLYAGYRFFVTFAPRDEPGDAP